MEAVATEPKQAKLPKVVKYVPLTDASGKSPYSFQDANGVRSELKILADQNIPNTDVVTENGIEKEIRYLAACDSIYLEEQLKRGFPRDYKLQTTDHIFMSNGLLVVFPHTEKNKYDYLEKCNFNGSNPSRKKHRKALFMLDDADKKNKYVLDNDRILTKAKSIIYQIEEDEAKLRNVASQLTLDMNAEPQALIMQLKTIAEKSPQLIIDAYGNNSGDASALVWDAVEQNVISFNGFGWRWSESDEKISVPNMSGRQTEDKARKKLVDFLTSEAGDATRQLLETVIKERK